MRTDQHKDVAKRCEWVTNDSIYIHYHDNEWGIAQYESEKLFEKLCLEGQQAGLSWITVLKKRQEYRRCFFDFDPYKIITIQDIEPLMQNKGLIRNRLKLNAIIKNARAYLTMEEQGEDFSEFIWSFVGGRPTDNRFVTSKEIPAHTAESDIMAKALKKRGFTFVGTTICYAFMQSMGLVNDHLVGCHFR